ncbi:DUF6602 domain-containing protein [Brevifollis gellanilyticus]|uniref:DUF6602 domain-containing protein n=1 Tax=Brevifollis gellanilyticus TaxID=748831 RepID=A0A512MGK2_9BACT|nr:DUF6602 domain-containing protein [Brevifollis gellanilyticus]GEP45872.1 hypothetical protein BGE01nite_51630 [Brevifollis gellanilyticus]
MLKNHMARIEDLLLAQSRIAANTGHNLHKGTPREAFVRGFLEEHLSERVAIGTGEIIDANSKPGEKRNQIDIVVYRRDFPKLSFGGGVNGFLAESVVATIEVKSVLDIPAMKQSIETAHRIKGLTRNLVTTFKAGYQPPSILSFVVAYDGPASMNTVRAWLPDIHNELGIDDPRMPPNLAQRTSVPSPSIDGVIRLGCGVVYFDNCPSGFINEDGDGFRASHPYLNWVTVNMAEGSLLWFFLILSQAVSGVSASWLDPAPYVANFRSDDISLGSGSWEASLRDG